MAPSIIEHFVAYLIVLCIVDVGTKEIDKKEITFVFSIIWVIFQRKGDTKKCEY